MTKEVLYRSALVTAVLLVSIGLLPLRYVACPDWEVTVVDASGTPVQGMIVRRSCQDYSVQSIGSEDEATTDEGGKTFFMRKYLRAPIVLRWLGNVLNVVSQGVHASFGRHAYVSAFSKSMEGYPVRDGYVEVWTGSPESMESRIVVTPARSLFR